MAKEKKYVLVGTGGRSQMFYEAVVKGYHTTSQLCAFCDINQSRMDYANRLLKEEYKVKPVRTYMADQFDKMIKTEKPDVVIITSIDRTHHLYIIRAMELGCDVICEKPMTIDAEKCQAILDAVKKTGKKLRVTFNYRYGPYNTTLRELVMKDVIGRVNSVHFEWLLDTRHGADYFRRWHRDKRNSGGLLVHKATHHFDLVNFWLGTYPKTVFAMGDLMFYGRANAEERGVTKFYSRGTEHPNAKDCPFALNLKENAQLKAMYFNAEKEDGYLRDQSVFGDGISIEDTMGVMVRYSNNAILTYSLNAYMPWEGFRVALNGVKGRIEMTVGERTYINAAGKISDQGAIAYSSLFVLPMFGTPYEATVSKAEGAHGGGDVVLLDDLFGASPPKDPYKRAASHIDGAMSILTGIAANTSMKTGRPVNIADLVKL